LLRCDLRRQLIESTGAAEHLSKQHKERDREKGEDTLGEVKLDPNQSSVRGGSEDMNNYLERIIPFLPSAAPSGTPRGYRLAKSAERKYRADNSLVKGELPNPINNVGERGSDGADQEGPDFFCGLKTSRGISSHDPRGAINIIGDNSDWQRMFLQGNRKKRPKGEGEALSLA